MLLVAVGRAEHQEHALFRFEFNVGGCFHGFAIRRGDMPIGEIQRAYSSNTCSHQILPLADQRKLIGMGQQRPYRPGDRIARLVLAAGDRKLDVGAHAFHRQAAWQHHAEGRG